MFSSFNLPKAGKRCGRGDLTPATIFAFVCLEVVWPGSPCPLSSESEASLSLARKSRGSFQGGATQLYPGKMERVCHPPVPTSVTSSLSAQVTATQTFHGGSRSLQPHHLVVGVQERHSGLGACLHALGPCLPWPLRQVLLAPFRMRSLLTEGTIVLPVAQAGFRD